MARALLPALRHLAVVAALVVDHRPAAALQVMEMVAVEEVQAMEEAEAVLEVEAMEEAEAAQEVVAMEKAEAVQEVEAVALLPSLSQSPSAPMAQSPPRPAPQASPAHLQVDPLKATTATPQSPAQAARSVPSQDRLFTTPSPTLRLAQRSPPALPTQAELVQPTQAELVLPSQVPASQSLRLAASSQATPSLTPVPASSLPVPASPSLSLVPARSILPVQGLRLQALVSPLAVLESQSQFLVPARPTCQVPALLQSTQAELLLPTQAELLLHTQAELASQLFRAQARHIHPAPDHLPAQLAALTPTHQRQPRSATPAAQLHTPRAPAQALRPSPAAQPTSEEVAVSTHAPGFRMSKFPRSMLSNSG